ncbi:MAG TPA: FTR1 family protein [Pyrinomonadaceae bacterium]|nr:FTR1 family protein [Pyrinomonadaceae bacterium]
MLNSFIIVMREGFESFLLVAVILAYLKKSEQKWLNSSVYVAIAAALAASAGLAYVLNVGVEETTVTNMFGATLGAYVNQFFANEALREAVLGAIAVVMVGTLVIHMWRHGPKVQQRMREKLEAVSSKSSSVAAVLGVFLFTFLMITREGMETALMLMQVKDPNLINGALLGLAAAIAFAIGWAKFSHLINVRRFFQVTGIFLLLFMVQVSIYSFHEFAEAGLLPNSEFLHELPRSFHLTGSTANGFHRS